MTTMRICDSNAPRRRPRPQRSSPSRARESATTAPEAGPMARLKSVSHEDELSLVEHLDELRTRNIVCVSVLVVAMSFCFWQNDRLLEIASGPLPDGQKSLITLGVTEAFTTTLTVS